MKSGFRQIFTLLTLLLFSITVPAQDIPVLPDDPSVLKGVMPNGMSYYLISNAGVAGVADFALVQRTGRKTAPDSIASRSIEAARESLAYLPRLKNSSPHSYLSRHGVAPGSEGYVKVTDDATIFRFRNVTLSGTEVLDSTILVLMDIADRANTSGDEFVSRWYTAEDQAIIISGDINAKSVADKLRNMSFMMPSDKSVSRHVHEWGENEDAVFDADTSGVSPFADVSLTWVSRRVPREYMNTVQPAIFDMSVNTLGELAVRRIRKEMERKGMPVADVSYDHVCSESTPYDDSFTVGITMRKEDAADALIVAAQVMASIDAAGVGKDEFVLAEAKCMNVMAEEAAVAVRGNEEYLDRCINAFLYNASLASPKERLAFHLSRNLPDTMRCRLFNDIAKAMLDGSANLRVRCHGDSLSLKEAFDSVWTMSSGQIASDINMSDTLSFPDKSPRQKVRSVKTDPVSGGSIWTFANGFKVVYKKMASDRLYYGLALNGGYSSISGLEQGEGPFVTDYMKSCHVGGLKGESFMDILQIMGITMDVKVNLSNTLIRGNLPYDRVRLLLRSLLALANERTPDEEAFDYYKECGYMAMDAGQGGFTARMTAIDSIMCPDFRYTQYKSSGKVTSGFSKRADAFLDDAFSKMNDGVLVLVGNMDEEKLKKLLMDYVGGFRTRDFAFRRPVMRYQPVSGWSTYTVDGDRNCVDVALSARMPVTAENYIAAYFATEFLRRRFTEVLSDSGMHAEVSYNCRIYPEERYNLLLSLTEASEDGFASGMVPETPISALAKVRTVLSELHSIQISDAELKMFKARLKNEIATEMKDPSYWVDAIVLRYLDGKDLSTGYAAKIDSVTPAKVQAVLNMLDAGCKIEYVTSKKY